MKNSEANKEDTLMVWQEMGRPYEQIIEKIKKDNPPIAKMSVVEMLFANCIKTAIESSHKHELKTDHDLAAYIVGYLSSLGFMPKSK